MRVDAHHHLWDLSLVPQPWIVGEELAPINRSFGPDDLVAAAGAHVDRSVVVQTVSDSVETPILLQYAADHPMVAGVVGWVDLTAPDVAEQLAAMQAAPNGDYLVGIRHQVQGEVDPRWLCRDDVIHGLRAVGEAGLVYDLLTLPAQLEAAAEAVRAVPETSFVLNHMSKPPIKAGLTEPWTTDIVRLAAAENVACKLSGLVTEADWDAWTTADLEPYVETVLNAFGPNRIMFGSDWPVCLLAARYTEVVRAATTLLDDLSIDEQAQIFGGSAQRIYGLVALGDREL